jgi:hypothetical protein
VSHLSQVPPKYHSRSQGSTTHPVSEALAEM